MVRIKRTGYESLQSDDEDEAVYRTESSEDLSAYQTQLARITAPNVREGNYAGYAADQPTSPTLGVKFLSPRRPSRKLSVIPEEGGEQGRRRSGAGYRRMTVGDVMGEDVATQLFSSFRGGSHSLGTLTDKETGRRYSAVVDTSTGVPVAILETAAAGASKKIDVRPVSRGVSRNNTRTNSIIQLLNDPFGDSDQPIAIKDTNYFVSYSGLEPISYSGLEPISSWSRQNSVQQQAVSKPPRRVTTTDYKALRSRGNVIRMEDYKVINTSVASIIFFIVTGITFLAAWQGRVWVLFLAVGLVILLVACSCLAVKIHFLRKRNRSEKWYTAARRATMCSHTAAALSLSVQDDVGARLMPLQNL